MFFSMFLQGGVHRLESVEEYNELMLRNGDPRVRMLEVSRDGRKHSLPQLLDSTGTSQVIQYHGAFLFSQSCLVRDVRACFHPWVSRLSFTPPETNKSIHVVKNNMCGGRSI